jgi:membrane protease YdiL (CAAX protease family)
MNSSLIWKQEYSEPVISLSVTLISFLIYYFAGNSDILDHKIKRKYGIKRIQEFRVYFRHISGFIFLGAVPLLVVLILLPGRLTDYGLGLSIGMNIFYYTVLISAIIILMNFFASKSATNLEKYPLIRTKNWNMKLLVLSLSGWIIYLAAYEFLFRGFLFFTCIHAFGIWPSIVINVLIYSFAHIPQGIKETAGAIPFGFLLCCFTILSGTIWPALILHIVLAVSNEWFSIYNSTEISARFFSSGK